MPNVTPMKHGGQLPLTPSPLHCYNTGLTPMHCGCPTCHYYRMYYTSAYLTDGSPYHASNVVHSTPAFTPVRLFGQHGHPVASPTNVRHEHTPTLSELRGKFVESACTASGRSAIQSGLSTNDPVFVDAVLDEFLCGLETVALDTHGCHALRSLVDLLNEEQLMRLMRSMTDRLVLNMCTLSPYTRRVLQALFERRRIDLQPVVEVLASNAPYLAMTQQGCISLIKIYQTCSHPQKAMLMAPLLSNFVSSASDPFGNYVVQCAVEHSDKVTASRYVREYFKGHLADMSCNKFASNVVEKIVSCVNVPVTRRIVVDELVNEPEALQRLMHDAYGNFVIQAIIDTCSASNEFKRLCDRIRPLIASTPFGSRIDARIRGKRGMLAPAGCAGATTVLDASPKPSVAAVC